MYAGIQEDGKFRNYRKGEGKSLIKSLFDISTVPHLPRAIATKVEAVFKERESQIVNLLNQGKMTFDEYSLSDLDAKLRAFFTMVFRDLNSLSLPEMHPDYQEISIVKSRTAEDAESYANQLGKEQMAQLLNAVEMVTQRSQVYDSIPNMADEFDNPYMSLTDADAWGHTDKRSRTESSYMPNTNYNIVLDPMKPLSRFQAGQTTPRRRPPGTKVPWTDEETAVLEQGMNIFGNDWKAIKDHFSDVLFRRTNVNLKDRARNMKRKLIKMGAPLGVWQNACN
jgi:hypothetical protein